jgi:short-chain fatty acids transporter
MDWWPGWNLLVALSIFVWLCWWFYTKGIGTWTIDIYNMVFLGFACLFHYRPKPFLDACTEGAKNVWGIILQFPFYAGMFGLITYTKLGETITEFFVKISSPGTYLPIVYLYSGILNYFIPSGGSKWSIEATYMLRAGRQLGVSDAAVILAYSWGDMMTDLIQPFFAIPLLAVAGLKFGQIMGYCTVVCFFYALIITLCMFFMPITLGG